MPGVFTDYSGRTFNCTAYEYAYWAKDKHMCRMLEQRMDPQTKEAMLNRIDNLEQDGLTYEQHDQVISHSKHFDVTPLKTALEHYISNFRELWRKEHRLSITDEGDVIPQNRVLKAAWLDIGCQQRELPVHVINEYCRKDPLFSASTFNEDHLPRVLTFKGDDIDDGAFFPINSSGSWIPEVHFTLRGLAGVSGEDLIGAGGRLQRDVFPETINKELSALSRLDEVRSADLKQSRENLASNHLLRPL